MTKLDKSIALQNRTRVQLLRMQREGMDVQDTLNLTMDVIGKLADKQLVLMDTYRREQLAK